MYGLLKIANEKNQKIGTPEAVGTAAGLAVGTHAGRHRLTGLQRFYHGTGQQHVEGIMRDGLLAAKGGAEGATLPESGNLDQSVGKLHLTNNKKVGNYHANFHDMSRDDLYYANMFDEKRMMQPPKNGKGVVLSGKIPYARFDQMELDPVFNALNMEQLDGLSKRLKELPVTKNLLRDIASRGEIDVLPIEIDGSGHALKDRLRHYAGEFPGYVKQYPGRFASGVGLAGGGALAGGLLAHHNTEE